MQHHKASTDQTMAIHPPATTTTTSHTWTGSEDRSLRFVGLCSIPIHRNLYSYSSPVLVVLHVQRWLVVRVKAELLDKRWWWSINYWLPLRGTERLRLLPGNDTRFFHHHPDQPANHSSFSCGADDAVTVWCYARGLMAAVGSGSLLLLLLCLLLLSLSTGSHISFSLVVVGTLLWRTGHPRTWRLLRTHQVKWLRICVLVPTHVARPPAENNVKQYSA